MSGANGVMHEGTEIDMTKSEKMKHCAGCRNDYYNIPGNTFSGDCCWSLASMKLEWRKLVHVDQVPPWNQKAQRLPSCYSKPRYVCVGKDRTQ
jgi:hypothetical protein